MSAAQADMLFLENAMGLPMYGVDLHPAKVILFSELNLNSNLENIWKVFIIVISKMKTLASLVHLYVIFSPYNLIENVLFIQLKFTLDSFFLYTYNSLSSAEQKIHF